MVRANSGFLQSGKDILLNRGSGIWGFEKLGTRIKSPSYGFGKGLRNLEIL